MKTSVPGIVVVRCGAVLGFLAVALGAFGAHALKGVLEEAGMVATWKTAVLYHVVHALLVVGLGLFSVSKDGASGRVPAGLCGCLIGGVLLFSGSLYGLALGGPGWLGPVTPLGGVGFLLGWLWLAVQPVAAKVTESSQRTN